MEKHSLPEQGSASSSGTATPKDLEAASTISDTTRVNTSLPTESKDERTWPRGWRPYATLFACWLLMFNSWGQVNAFGTFASYYSQHLFVGKDLLLFNLIGATQCFIILLLSSLVGRLLDAGHAKALAATGTILCFVGNLSLSFVNGQGRSGQGNYPLTWVCQGLINGLGMSCFFVTSSQVAASWFPNCKAIVIGIVATGASGSGLIYPMMIKFLIAKSGFKVAVWGYTGLVTGTCVIASIILLIKNPNHVYRKPKSWADPKVWVDINAFKDPAFCWLTAGVCWMFFGFYAVFFNLEDWAAYNGFAYRDVPEGLDIHLKNEVQNDAIRTFWLLCCMNASSTIGRLGSAMFAHRFGALSIHAVVTIFSAILLLAIWTVAKTLGPALIFVILYGAISGAVIGLPPASMAHVLVHRAESAASSAVNTIVDSADRDNAKPMAMSASRTTNNAVDTLALSAAPTTASTATTFVATAIPQSTSPLTMNATSTPAITISTPTLPLSRAPTLAATSTTLPPPALTTTTMPTPSTTSTSPINLLGQYTGLMYTISSPFALAGPIIAGHLVSHYHTYLAVQLWAGGCLVCAGVCYLIGAWYLRKRDWKDVVGEGVRGLWLRVKVVGRRRGEGGGDGGGEKE